MPSKLPVHFPVLGNGLLTVPGISPTPRGRAEGTAGSAAAITATAVDRYGTTCGRNERRPGARVYQDALRQSNRTAMAAHRDVARTAVKGSGVDFNTVNVATGVAYGKTGRRIRAATQGDVTAIADN